MNKECYNCGKNNKPTSERYQCIEGQITKFKPQLIGDKIYRIIPENLENWCIDCYKVDIKYVEQK